MKLNSVCAREYKTEPLRHLVIISCNQGLFFPFQDSSYLDELSNNSLFSSPADSLSDIADAQDFLPADSLNHVPTIWDINTSQQNQIEVSESPSPFLPTQKFKSQDLSLQLCYQISFPGIRKSISGEAVLPSDPDDVLLPVRLIQCLRKSSGYPILMTFQRAPA